MIKKFSEIKNIGSFFLFDWDMVNPVAVLLSNGQPKLRNGVPETIDNTFGKYNVLFGENGTGKSTLVRIFKSLNTDSAELLKKHWDHESDPSSILIITDPLPPINYDDTNGLQNNPFKEKIQIFDRAFVDNFVHSSSATRTTGHNKNTGGLILYLGNFFQYKKQLENLSQLKKSLVEQNQLLKQQQEKDYALLTSEFLYADTQAAHSALTATEVADLPGTILREESTVEVTGKELESVKQRIAQSAEINTTAAPRPLGIPLAPNEAEIVGAFDFSVGAATAKTLSTMSGREDFIRQGIALTHQHKLDTCPFCEQGIKKGSVYIDSIQEYEKVFDAAFSDGQQKTIKALTDYREKILSLIGLRAPDGNTATVTKLNKLLAKSFVLPELSLTAAETDLLKEELQNVENKLSEITTKKQTRAKETIGIFASVKVRIDDYNKSIKDVSDELVKAKIDVSSGDLPKQKQALEEKLSIARLKLFACRNYSQLLDVFTKVSNIAKNDKTIKKIEDIFEKLRTRIEGLFKTFVDTYFAEIEKNLAGFCPGLELKMKGSSPRYDLRVGDVTCGLEVHYKNKDRLFELSDGERQAIALSYFLAYLNKDSNKANKIVVFDDPINSFDAGKRKQVAEAIYQEAKDYRQLFIFTCDSLFRGYCLKVKNLTPGATRHFYYILKSASSAIHFRPRELMSVYSSFRNDFRNIASVVGTDDMIVVYGQKLRYCLEEIKDRHLGYSEDKFEEVLNRVRDGNVSRLIPKIEEIKEIYSYCNTGGLAHYPKDGQTSWQELKSQIARYVRLGL